MVQGMGSSTAGDFLGSSTGHCFRDRNETTARPTLNPSGFILKRLHRAHFLTVRVLLPELGAMPDVAGVKTAEMGYKPVAFVIV